MVDVRMVTNVADLELVLDVYNRVRPKEALALPDVQAFIARTLETTDYLASIDDAIVGGGFASLLHEQEDPRIDVIVLPAYRRRGIGSVLYDVVSSWARERGREALAVWVDDADADGTAFARRRGFVEIARELRVVLDLRRSTRRVDPPAGIEIVTWAERPDVAHGMYDVAVEAFPDIPGNEEQLVPPFDRWLSHHMSGSGDRSDATFVALHGDEVTGYAKFSFTDAQPTTAQHQLTAVKRAWRSRGIARALKSAQIEWARRNGYERLATTNEERNAPIRRLNAEFGYEPDGARLLMRGPLSDAT